MKRKERTEFRIGLQRNSNCWMGTTCYGEVEFCSSGVLSTNPRLRSHTTITLTVTAKPRPGFLPVILSRSKNMWYWTVPNITPMYSNIFGHSEYVTDAIICRLKKKSVARLPKQGVRLWFKFD